jgi:hypothetical protein
LSIIKRFPSFQQIIPVYAVTVMMIYGWTIYRYIWEIPSWLYFLSLADVFRIYAYALSVNFMESLVLLTLPLVICLILPRKWFYESFIARGSTLVILLLGYLMYFSNSFKSISGDFDPQLLINWTPAVLIVIAALVFASGRIRVLSRIVEDFSSRAVIFLYISIPASVFSLLYIIARNIFWSTLHG